MRAWFAVGGAVSIAVSVVTVFIKSAISRYPGVGDFLVFNLLPESVQGRFHLCALYLAKAALALCAYGLAYALLRWMRPFVRTANAAAISGILSACLSLGEAVVA